MELCSQNRLQANLSSNSNTYKRVKKGASFYVKVITPTGRVFYCMRHTTEKYFNSAVEVLKELEYEEGLRAFNVNNLKRLSEDGYFEGM